MSDDLAFDAAVEVERLGRHYSDGEGLPVIEIRTGRLLTILRDLATKAAAAEAEKWRALDAQRNEQLRWAKRGEAKK